MGIIEKNCTREIEIASGIETEGEENIEIEEVGREKKIRKNIFICGC